MELVKRKPTSTGRGTVWTMAACRDRTLEDHDMVFTHVDHATPDLRARTIFAAAVGRNSHEDLGPYSGDGCRGRAMGSTMHLCYDLASRRFGALMEAFGNINECADLE